MKVTTEGCILGAWTNGPEPQRILDIGTGTGLLAFMLAQKYQCPIDAVELEYAAANQARSNFESSIWSSQFKLYQEDVVGFSASTKNLYDLIVCNPPFFKSNLRSHDSEKNLAIHDSTLSHDMLLAVIEKLLSSDGRAFVLYPEFEANRFMTIIDESSLVCQESLIVKNNPGKTVFRKIIELSKSSNQVELTKELCIRNNQGGFTDEYVNLLKPYYLHL